jgi:hypothetical protein
MRPLAILTVLVLAGCANVATPSPRPTLPAGTFYSWSTGAFVAQWGVTPQQETKLILDGIVAGGGHPDAGNITAAQASQYGGYAGAAAWAITHGQTYPGEYFVAAGQQLVQLGPGGTLVPVQSPAFPAMWPPK